MEATSQKVGQVSTAKTLSVASALPLPTTAPHSPVMPSGTPLQMLNAAISQGMNPDILGRLMDLQEKWEAGQARKAFLAAKAAFKAEAPKIIKDKDNKQYGSKYASIDNVVNSVNTALSKHGLDASWTFEQSTDGNAVTVTCILSHADGHSEKASLTDVRDKSGAKNQLQQLKSTITYLKIATYEAVTGVASREGNVDDDGNGSGAPDAYITDDQANTILGMLSETGTSAKSFCNHFGIDGVALLPAKKFKEAFQALNARRKAK